MGEFIYSPSKNMFYVKSMQERYESTGIWPDDPVDVTDQAVEIYTSEPPNGMTRGSDANGNPVWVEI